MKSRALPLFLLCLLIRLPAGAQHLDSLAREMVFGTDTGCSRISYRYFLSLLSDRKLESEPILQANGMAISPEAAAGCMLEHTRTQVFVRGLYRAAKSLNKDSIRILYVGCGPLAPFMTLTAPLLPGARYTLVEISENAAEAAKVLINRLHLQGRLDTLIIADATNMKVPEATSYDIVITETMDAGLNNEMMIPILINILPQLKREVILIPEEVTLELLVSKRTGVGERTERFPVFTATDLLNCFWENGKFPAMEFAVPEPNGSTTFIITTVRVFRDICLNPGESAITRTLRVMPTLGKPLQFGYGITPPGLALGQGEMGY